MNRLRAITYGTVCETRSFLRVQKAFFFTIVFPIFLYVVFVMIWGNDTPEYSRFLLTGIIAITVVSNSILAIGDVIVKYYENGMFRVFKTLSYSFNYHIISLVLSRLVMMIAATIFLLLFALIFNHLTFTPKELLQIVCGVVSGMILFSLIGILLGEFVESKKSENTVMNSVFYIIIFVSDSFYPVSEMNPSLSYILNINPITPILNMMRGSGTYWPLFIWIPVLLALQIIGWKHLKIKR